MHLSTLTSCGRRLCGALITAVLLTSCNHDGPTDPVSRVHALRPVDSTLQVGAGTQYMLSIVVVDADGRPVSNVDVNWQAPAGVLGSETSRSSSTGVATERWTAPRELGSVTLTASVGSVSLPLAVDVIPGPVAKLDILEDSVRFTAQLQARTVRVLGIDQFGHQVVLGTNVVQSGASYAQVRSTAAAGDTAVVTVESGFGTSRGYLGLASTDGHARDSILVILDPVIVRTQISGLDSTNGLAVGERAQLKVTGLDSLGFSVSNLDSARSRLQLSTSDPNVVTVADDGTVTAVAPGSVTIDASAPGTSYHQDITVYPVFDVGTRMSSVALHDVQAYSQTPLGSYLTDAGTLYDLSHYIGAGGPPHPTGSYLRATAISGKVLWTRSYSGSYATAVADPASGNMYLAVDSQHVMHAIDPAGTDRWSFDYGSIDKGSCRLAGWRDGVAAACGAHVFALNGAGSLVWSATVTDTVWQIISTQTLAVVRTRNSLTAFSDDGHVAWTKTSGAADMIADASSNVYVVENGVRALDANGAERWYNATPLGGCILATADKLVVCRNNRVITALDPGDGHVRWNATSATSYGSFAAISGDRILISGSFIFALDARTGGVLGRTLNPVGEYDLAVGNNVMAASSFSSALLFHTSFTPGTEWAQALGNAGHSNRVTP